MKALLEMTIRRLFDPYAAEVVEATGVTRVSLDTAVDGRIAMDHSRYVRSTRGG